MIDAWGIGIIAVEVAFIVGLLIGYLMGWGDEEKL